MLVNSYKLLLEASKLILLLGVFAVVNGCDSIWLNNNSPLENKPVIRAGVVKQRITYRKAYGHVEGLEADFLKHYAKDKKVKIKFIPFSSAEKLKLAVENNLVDVAAARFQTYDQALQGPIYDKENHMFLISPNNKALRVDMLKWFQKSSRYGVVGRIMDRYVGYRNYLEGMEVTSFQRAIRTRLPDYKSAFQRFAKEFDLPWKLVTAVAYQESAWNPDAQSFTGVRGMMQLTRETASFLGVEDREHPEQSIWGGAKYLRFLLNRQPEDLAYRERLSLALAAYNIGIAHLQDAQLVAVENGLDPYSWKDLKTILPKLEDAEFAANLRYGMARGNETVDFVNRVLSYSDLL